MAGHVLPTVASTYNLQVETNKEARSPVREQQDVVRLGEGYPLGTGNRSDAVISRSKGVAFR
jgi:hypothetical protein